MSLNEKLVLVGFGAAVGGVVAGVVVWATRPPAPPPAGQGPAVAVSANRRPNPSPGTLPGLTDGARSGLAASSGPPTTQPPPPKAPIDDALEAQGTAAKRGTPAYQAYRKALEEAAPRLRTLSFEEQSRELSIIADKYEPKPPQ